MLKGKDDSSEGPSSCQTSNAIKRSLSQANKQTTKSDFASKQANRLVERICHDHGIEAPKYTFAASLTAHHGRAIEWSIERHESVLKLAEYLQKRATIEAEYAQALRALGRGLLKGLGPAAARLDVELQDLDAAELSRSPEPTMAAVMIRPGQIELQVMPCVPNSCAIALVNPLSPCLVVT